MAAPKIAGQQSICCSNEQAALGQRVMARISGIISVGSTSVKGCTRLQSLAGLLCGRATRPIPLINSADRNVRRQNISSRCQMS
jgi:hypothetical protein